MKHRKFRRRRLALGALLVLAVALVFGATAARSSIPGTYRVNALNSNVPGAAPTPTRIWSMAGASSPRRTGHGGSPTTARTRRRCTTARV